MMTETLKKQDFAEKETEINIKRYEEQKDKREKEDEERRLNNKVKVNEELRKALGFQLQEKRMMKKEELKLN